MLACRRGHYRHSRVLRRARCFRSARRTKLSGTPSDAVTGRGKGGASARRRTPRCRRWSPSVRNPTVWVPWTLTRTARRGEVAPSAAAPIVSSNAPPQLRCLPALCPVGWPRRGVRGEGGENGGSIRHLEGGATVLARIGPCWHTVCQHGVGVPARKRAGTRGACWHTVCQHAEEAC